MVGLRRPGKRSLRRRRPTPGASAPWKADFNRRRAFGRRSACVPNEFGLRRPTADGRPAPTGKAFFASAEADAWRAAPEEADCNRRRAFGRRSACVPNGFGLQGPSADGRPAPTEKTLRVGGGRRPARQRLERPISIGAEPSADGRHAPTGKILRVGGGRRLARQRLKRPISIGAEPSADGRPAPSGKVFFASAQADAWRVSALERPISIGAEPSAGGRHACRMNSASGGLRPMVGMRRPGKRSLRRRRPTPGAERLRGRFQSAQSLRPAVGMRAE
jgi:hypothetical protein